MWTLQHDSKIVRPRAQPIKGFEWDVERERSSVKLGLKRREDPKFGSEHPLLPTSPLLLKDDGKQYTKQSDFIEIERRQAKS